MRSQKIITITFCNDLLRNLPGTHKNFAISVFVPNEFYCTGSYNLPCFNCILLPVVQCIKTYSPSTCHSLLVQSRGQSYSPLMLLFFSTNLIAACSIKILLYNLMIKNLQSLYIFLSTFFFLHSAERKFVFLSVISVTFNMWNHGILWYLYLNKMKWNTFLHDEVPRQGVYPFHCLCMWTFLLWAASSALPDTKRQETCHLVTHNQQNLSGQQILASMHHVMRLLYFFSCSLSLLFTDKMAFWLFKKLYKST